MSRQEPYCRGNHAHDKKGAFYWGRINQGKGARKPPGVHSRYILWPKLFASVVFFLQPTQRHHPLTSSQKKHHLLRYPICRCTQAACTVTSKLCQPLAMSSRLLSRSTATNVVSVDWITPGPPKSALVAPIKLDVCFVSNLTSKCFVH